MPRRTVPALLALATAAVPALAIPPAPAPARDGAPVFLSSCAVLFGVRSSGASSTRPGFMGGGTMYAKRIDKSIRRIFNLEGYDSTAFQRIADRLCGDAPAELAAAGYRVLTDSARTHFIWADRDSAGQDSPQEQKIGGTRYLVYARTGAPILDPGIVGGMKGPKILGWEVTIANQYALRPVGILYYVDFATIDAAKGGRFLGLNVAEVSTTLQVTVGASVMAYDASDAKCGRGAPFGKHKAREFCTLRGKAMEQGQYALPEGDELAFRDPITDVRDVTSGGQKFADALSGVLPSRRQVETDTKEFDVTVDMAKYEARAIEGAKGVLTKVMAAIIDPSLRKDDKK